MNVMSRSSTTNWRGVICGTLCGVAALWLSPPLSAQEVEIRRWNHLPIDGNFVIPLPARLYVKGEIKFRRISTDFDAPDLSAEEARSASDGTVNGTVHVGIQF